MLEISKIMELADEHQTPMYIFDLDELRLRMNTLQSIVGKDIHLCYAMKANPFLVHAMKPLAAKFEVCSPGEFSICERENVRMDMIVLSGVNKEKSDIDYVMDQCGGVGTYTVESVNQFYLLNECAKERNKKISVLLRVTSGNQFGLDEAQIEKIIANRLEYEYIEIRGIQCYTGTQKKKHDFIASEIEWLDGFCDSLKQKYDFTVKELEYGPGLPISYFGEDAYHNNFDMLKEFSKKLDSIRNKYEITLEMGRYMAATCGIFVSEVVDLKTNKEQNYCIIDGGINHINYYGQTMAMKIPAFTYVNKEGQAVAGGDMVTAQKITEQDLDKWTICGSLCTVGDVIVKNLPIGTPALGDRLVLYNIGAYSVTEGIYLFLSRRMPKIIAYARDTGAIVYRDFKYSDRINSRQELL
jgi:diaminopimelate decarboxylase